MAWKRRRWWIGALVALGTAVGVLLFFISGGAASRTQRLPDGGSITLKRIEHKKPHLIVRGNAWQRFAGEYFPENVLRRLGVPVWVVTNNSAAAMIFVQITTTSNPYPIFLPRAESFPLPSRAFPTGLILSDDAGNAFAINLGSCTVLSSNLWELGFPVPLVSRTAREYHLRFYFSDDGKQPTSLLAEFKIANPIQVSTPRWTSPPLPQTNHVGDFSVILVELSSQPAAPEAFGGQSFFPSNTRATLRIIENGNYAYSWHVAMVTVLDEDGNKYGPMPPTSVVRRGARGDEITIPGHFAPGDTRKFRFNLVGPPGTLPREVDFLARPGTN